MRNVVAQKDAFGCGVACCAYVGNRTYDQAAKLLGAEKAQTRGFYCRELIEVLSVWGMRYEFKYLKAHLRRKIYQPFTIVFISRSKRYPAGHYLARTSDGRWMDPWINFRLGSDVKKAKSGYRQKLPGTPIYALFPIGSKK